MKHIMKQQPVHFQQQRRTLVSMAVAMALAQYGIAHAAPVGHKVVAGQVTVTTPSVQQTVISQTSQAAVVNWQQFSIGATEHVDIRQPNASSVLLNRVIGNNPSEIYGRLSANGQVFLVNPNGVLFGRTAQVSVGGLVASTLDIANDDFLAGSYRFAGTSSAAVENQGAIEAAARGTVALLGGRVNNDGTITAKLGTAALAAGEKISLDFEGDGLTQIRVDKGAVAAQVANRGMIVTDGGQAVMTAHAAQALADTVLNQQGVVRARSLVERDGKIVLDGGAHGVTLNSGALDATGTAGLKGGTINVLGHHIGLTGQALVDASGDAGGGQIFVGGGVQGANPLLRHAAATFAGPQASLRADALTEGHGGTVVLWSDGSTRMFGAASARGGASGGDGGFIETSGKFLGLTGVRIDAAATRGKSGTWLLDPYDIAIVEIDNNLNVTGGPDFTSTGTGSELWNETLNTALDSGTSVSVTTGAGPGNGDIVVDADVTKSSTGDTTLTLNAARDIRIASDRQITSNGGALHVNLNADADGVGGGAIRMESGSTIATAGGNVRMYGQSDSAGGFASGWNPDGGDGVSLVDALIDTSSVAGPGGSIAIRGRGLSSAQPGSGVAIAGSILLTGSGNINVTGISGEGGYGLDLSSPTIATLAGGSIDLRGLALRSAGSTVVRNGLYADDANIYTSGGPGNITLTGESVGTLGMDLGNSLLGDSTTTGDIVLRAFNPEAGPSGGTMLAMPSSIDTSGLVGLIPGGLSATGALEARDNVQIGVGGSAPLAQFAIPQGALDTGLSSRVSGLVVGSSTHTGIIYFAASSPYVGSYDVTLQNGGAGSAGITLVDGFDMSGRDVVLSSGGSVTQEGGPIAANTLLLHGTQAASRFTLTDAGNAVSILSARFEQPRGAGAGNGDVNFNGVGRVEMSALSGFGLDGATNLRQTVSAADSVISGNLAVDVTGDVRVAQAVTLQDNLANLAINASNDLTVDGPITANGNNVLAGLTAGRDVDINATITMLGNNADLQIGAVNDVTMGAAVVLGGDDSTLSVDSGNNINASGGITLLGDRSTAEIFAGNNLNALADIAGSGSATFVTLGALGGDTLQSGNIGLAGAGSFLRIQAVRDVFAAGNASIGDGGFAMFAGRNLTLSGDTSTAGNASVNQLDANGNIILGAGARLFANGAGTLNLNLNADADNLNGGAIAMTSGASIDSNGGRVLLYGQSDQVAGYASGAGFTQRDGIVIDNATIATGGGVLTLRGRGTTPVTTGPVLAGSGVALNGATLNSGSGALAITGIGGLGGSGVLATSSTVATSAGGSIDMRGRSGAVAAGTPGAIGSGMTLSGSAVNAAGGGAILLSGESEGGSGLVLSGTNAVGSIGTTGNIVLRAFSTGAPASTPMLSLGGTLQTSLAVNLRPGGVSASGALTEQPGTVINFGGASAAGQFAISPVALDAAMQPNSAAVVIGSQAQTGAINVNTSAPLSGLYNLTLQNDGAGSGGINLLSGLSNPGRLLTLSSGGAVTQAGPVVAGSLLLRGTQPGSSFILDNSANAVSSLSASFMQPKGTGATDGDLRFTTSTNLLVGPLSGIGFDGATNLAQSIAMADTSIAGDLTLSAGGDLTLIQDVSMRAGGSTLALNAGRDIILGQDVGIALAAPTGALQVDLNADADGAGGGAIVIAPLASIATNGGNVRLFGQSNAAGGFASGSSPTSATGISVAGTIDATGSGGSGSVTMFGRGVAGGGSAGSGIAINSGIVNAGGSIGMTGIGAPGGSGVQIGSSPVTSLGGAIDIRGRAGADLGGTFGNGVIVNNASISNSGAAGIAISGEAFSGSGVAMLGATSVGAAATSGNIVIKALNTGTARTFDAGGTLRTTGVVNIRPGGVAASGVTTESNSSVINIGGAATAGEFSMTQDLFVSGIQAGVPAVIVGANAHSGAINVLASGPLGGSYDLTLQNSGAASGGINLYNGLAIPGRMLTLSTGGRVTQGAAIVAGRLLLHGTAPQSSFELANTGNAVGRVSARFEVLKGTAATDGDVNFASGGNLEIGPLTGLGFNAASGLTEAIAAANAVVAGDIVAQASGNLSLLQNVSTLGSDITLVTGGVLLNPANATLSPGGGGRWRVFADTWVGEVDGGLTGSAPTPNFYNCAFGGACMTLLPGTNNYFTYRQQPVLNVALTTPTQTRVYGTANAAFPFTASGLVNGDTLAASLAGGYNVPAAIDVGTYAVAGAFSSPVGYLVNAAPGSINVTPATLTYVAAPASRNSGQVNPPLTGTVTGLVNGDTLSAATTGALTFTSAAPVMAVAGSYAINGGGLAARNYVFQDAPSNLTALTVNAASIQMPSIVNDVSMPASDLYGANYGSQRACVGSGPLASASGSGDANDTLAMEWSRVRESPNLSNCIGLAQRYSCGDF